MARQTYYVTRDMKNPLRYPTRMLTAGQEVTLSGSAADLFRKVGVELSEEKPRKVSAPRPAQSEAEKANARQAEAPKPAAKPKAKRAPRKKAAAKKK